MYFRRAPSLPTPPLTTACSGGYRSTKHLEGDYPGYGKLKTPNGFYPGEGGHLDEVRGGVQGRVGRAEAWTVFGRQISGCAIMHYHSKPITLPLTSQIGKGRGGGMDQGCQGPLHTQQTLKSYTLDQASAIRGEGCRFAPMGTAGKWQEAPKLLLHRCMTRSGLALGRASTSTCPSRTREWAMRTTG